MNLSAAAVFLGISCIQHSGAGAIVVLLPSLSVFTALVALYMRRCDLIYQPEKRESHLILGSVGRGGWFLTSFLNCLQRLWTHRTAGVCSGRMSRSAFTSLPCAETQLQLSDTLFHSGRTKHQCSRSHSSVSWETLTCIIHIHNIAYVIHTTHYILCEYLG